jgi:hypothetical protein
VSATGRGAAREPEDYYTTPSWCVRRLLEEWKPIRSDGIWVEPGAGNGAIIRTVNAVLGPRDWRAYEIREEEREALTEAGCPPMICNFLHAEPAPWMGRATVVCGNPPYNQAFEFLRQAHHLFPMAEIVLLLRQAFTASAERYHFMRVHVPDIFALPDRPSFTGKGGDATDYAWMHWPRTWERTSGAFHLLAQTSDIERSQDRGHHVVLVPPQRSLFS